MRARLLLLTRQRNRRAPLGGGEIGVRIVQQNERLIVAKPAVRQDHRQRVPCLRLLVDRRKTQELVQRSDGGRRWRRGASPFSLLAPTAPADDVVLVQRSYRLSEHRWVAFCG